MLLIYRFCDFFFFADFELEGVFRTIWVNPSDFTGKLRQKSRSARCMFLRDLVEEWGRAESSEQDAASLTPKTTSCHELKTHTY